MPEQILAPPLHFKGPGWALRSVEWLKKKEAKIGQRAYQKGYRQNPSVEGEKFFPNFQPGVIYVYGEDWQKISNPDPENKSYDVTHPSYVDPSWPRYVGMDVSSSKRRGTVIFVLAISPSGMRHVLDIRIGAWTHKQTLDELQAVDDFHKPRIILIESNTLQESYQDNLRDFGYACAGKVKGFQTTHLTKLDQEVGLPGIDLQFANRRWRVAVAHSRGVVTEVDPKNPGECICGFCTFIKDASTFIYDDIDKTPDTLMAMLFAKEASRQGEDFNLTSMSMVRITQEDIRRSSNRHDVAAQAARFKIPVGVSVYANGQFGRSASRKTDFGRHNT